MRPTPASIYATHLVRSHGRIIARSIAQSQRDIATRIEDRKFWCEVLENLR